MTDLFGNRLTVCIDAGSLSGYLAIESTLALVRGSNIDTGWLPLTTGLRRLSARQPNEAPDDPLAIYKARRAKARETWARRELQRDCERLGITVDAGARQFESDLAGTGVLYLNERGRDVASYLQQVYKRAFRDGADISQIEEIGRCVGDEGFGAWAQSAGYEALELLQNQLLEAGVFSSPAYVVNGEVFQGRQHLPLLQSMLLSSD